MRVTANEGHTIWAGQYDQELNPVLALESRVLVNLINPIRDHFVLDIACGTGRWMQYVCDRGGSVFGSDACEAMLRVAERKQGLAGRCVLADAACLPFSTGSADMTICSFAAGYFSDMAGAMRELARVTRRKGRVVVSDLHPTAAATGWKRSFKANGTRYEMDHCGYTEDDFLSAAARSGLQPQRQVSATFGPPEFELFKTAGKTDSFLEASAIPAVWIGVWERI